MDLDTQRTIAYSIIIVFLIIVVNVGARKTVKRRQVRRTGRAGARPAAKRSSARPRPRK